MSNEVFSESLAFPQMKRRAVSARSFRVKIPPSNSTSFKQEQTIQVDLPGNLAGQYYNFNQMYLKFKVTLTGGAADLDRCGALGFIKRLQISTAGAQLCDINNWNVLATSMMDTDCSCEYKAGYGNILLGTVGDALKGVNVAAATPRVFCVPICLNPLAMTTPHRLIPAFSLSSIQLRFTLDSIVSSLKQEAANVTSIDFTEVELVAMMTELSPQAQAQIDAATGRRYNILASSFMNSSATKVAADTTLTANLGFSVSSLERIIAIHRPQASTTSATAYSLGNRAKAGLTQYQYLINSESYPARPVLVSSFGAEVLAETLIADHALVDFKKSSSFQNGVIQNTAAAAGFMVGAISGVAPQLAKADPFNVGYDDGTVSGDSTVAAADDANSNIGTFVCATEFENSLSDGKSATIYSGISTIASVVQWVAQYDGTGAGPYTIDFFAQFSVLLSLDMARQGVWSVSV